MNMPWRISNRCDPVARDLADRHYNRQSIGAKNFMPPGRCIVLVSPVDANDVGEAKAYWGSSWPYAQYVRHAWAGAWICSAFRNEGAGLSSDLIRSAVAATRAVWGDPPELGFVTFVNPDKVKRKRDWGRCYRKAGWVECGETKGGLVALQLLPSDMPPPVAPIGYSAMMEVCSN